MSPPMTNEVNESNSQHSEISTRVPSSPILCVRLRDNRGILPPLLPSSPPPLISSSSSSILLLLILLLLLFLPRISNHLSVSTFASPNPEKGVCLFRRIKLSKEKKLEGKRKRALDWAKTWFFLLIDTSKAFFLIVFCGFLPGQVLTESKMHHETGNDIANE